MWRVHGFVGRVLHRCHGSPPLRLPQNQGQSQGLGEVEGIHSSAVISSSRHSSDISSQKEEDGERRKKQRTSQFGYTELPRYTALDAVGWGAAAVLFMQLCKRIHSQFSSNTEQSPIPGALTAPSTLHKCGYRILLEILSRGDVLPRGRSVLCLQGRALLSQDSPVPEESLLSASCPLQNDDNTETQDANDKDMLSDEERLAGAALNLRHVGETSVPVILNIIGLENANSKNYEEAFTCFLAAAQQGYSKAQFNTGVCYEKGRGVEKDKQKALYYYWQAAAGGHRQAQYRYAKLLLTSRGQQSLEQLNTAINLLEQAAAAGLTKEPDDTALLLLGQCFESGFGVQQDLRTAIKYYRRSAQAGNKQAKSLLTPPNDASRKAEDAILRSIRSAPCFSEAERHIQQPLLSLACRLLPSTSPPVTLPLLPHSWSTGSLCVPPALSCTPLHPHPSSTEGGACQWTVGIG
ncbi:DAP3-binding cell death enhancer 1 [Dissostichus eleginoides]|uniref:DAP3-binding cell death enhancer 1 n=1 Tax=Dissostichus eleginoides TaxID=100907 RepID=A0AAD9CQX6_DISEL|nr:DAP3-binding cell death enhancer 1 [Dissostichus eleginoides]